MKEQAARDAVATFGLPIEVEPHQALVDELYRAAGHVAWLAAQIQMLEDDADSLVETVFEGANQPTVLVRLYQQERAHLTRVAVECIKVGVEERRVRVVEAMAGQLQAYTRALVASLGLDIADPKVRTAIETAALELDPGRAA